MTNQSAEGLEAQRTLFNNWLADEPVAPEGKRPKYKKINTDMATNLAIAAIMFAAGVAVGCCIPLFKESAWAWVWATPVTVLAAAITIAIAYLVASGTVHYLQRINRARERAVLEGTGWLEYDAQLQSWKQVGETRFAQLAEIDRDVYRTMRNRGCDVSNPHMISMR